MAEMIRTLGQVAEDPTSRILVRDNVRLAVATTAAVAGVQRQVTVLG